MTRINLLELWELWENPSSLSSLSCHQVTYISRNSASGIGPFQHLTSPLPYIISDPRPQTQRSLCCDDSSSCLSPAVTINLFQTGGCGSQYSSVWVFVPSRQTVSSAASHVGLVRAVMDSAEASSALQFSHYCAFTRQMFLTVTTFSLGGSRSQKRSFRTFDASVPRLLLGVSRWTHLQLFYTWFQWILVRNTRHPKIWGDWRAKGLITGLINQPNISEHLLIVRVLGHIFSGFTWKQIACLLFSLWTLWPAGGTKTNLFVCVCVCNWNSLHCYSNVLQRLRKWVCILSVLAYCIQHMNIILGILSTLDLIWSWNQSGMLPV